PDMTLDEPSSTTLTSVEQIDNTAEYSTGKCHYQMQTATPASGMDRASIVTSAKQRKNSSAATPRSCKGASFILPKGSVLPTWEAGPSIPTASTIGLPNYFGCTDAIQPANRLVFRNTWIVSTHTIASSWQT